MTPTAHEQQIRIIAETMWSKHYNTLQRVCLTFDDVYQETWVQFMILEQEWPDYPYHLISKRLISWMRKVSGYQRIKKLAPVYISFDNMYDKVQKLEYNSQSVFVDRIITEPPLYEARDVVNKMWSIASKREKIIMYLYILCDRPFKTIGNLLHITESRVSQIYGRLIMKTRNILQLTMLMVVLFIPSVLWAQVTKLDNCANKITWNANSEADLAGYKLYYRDQSAPNFNNPIDIIAPSTSYPCSQLGLQEGHTYEVQLTAYDTSGNESLPTDPLAFAKLDLTPPAIVTNLCQEATEIIIDSATGAVISTTPKTICQVVP